MHIQKIEVSNVLGLSRADIVCSQPVMIIAGNNEAGKSTIADAVSMAILGTPRRVKLKKELGQLLHDDAEKGRVTVIADGEVMGEFRLPGGQHKAQAVRGAEFLPLVLDPAAFARMDAKERRTTLYMLTKSKISADVVEAKLIERGISEAMAADIKPLLRGGFPATCEELADRAKEAKGAWKAVTGEQWGSEKAKDWAPELPTAKVDAEELAASRKQLESLAADLNEAQQSLGAAKQSAQSAEQRAASIQRLQELAELADRRAAKLAVDESNWAEWSAKLQSAEAAASGAPAITPHECPHCQGLIEVRRQPNAYPELHAYVEPEAVADPEAGKRATEYRGYRDSAQRAVQNSKRDLQESQDAAAQVVALQAEQAKAPSAEAITNAEQVINELRQDRDKVQAKVDALSEAQAALESRADTIAKAAEHHGKVMGWLAAAEALAPDGIPGEILGHALTPVNDSLAVLSRLSGWKKVVITDDMEITCDGRLYGLMSESAKWRADTLLALVIAQISELRMVILDRFDVLDMNGRSQLLNMLVELGNMKAMDSMIMSGTMKALPEKLPAEVAGVWIANGIAETAQ